MQVTSSARESLARIADVLGISVADFYDPAGSKLANGAELMRLWDAIPDEVGREQVMLLARELAVNPAVPEKLAAE